MEIMEEEIFSKNCYKSEELILDNLNLFYITSNFKIILWNKYQIFVYKNLEFECLEKTIDPDFQIRLLIATNNYLLCLDTDGKVHVTSLKFKSKNTLKVPSQPRDDHIKICVKYDDDSSLSLKYEADAYFLCLHKINLDFQLEKQIILILKNEEWPLEEYPQDRYLLLTESLDKTNFEEVNKIFKTDDTFQGQNDLVVLSVDKLNIYAGLLCPKSNNSEITLVKLYCCPAKICNMKIINAGDLYLVIGLEMGTIIRLLLRDTCNKPDVAHLNAALHKMIALKDSMIYTDGTTMWKGEDVFTEKKFKQFFVKNTYDIIRCGDQIICSTFNKLVYTFSEDDNSSYLNPEIDSYCPAEKLLQDSGHMHKLFDEMAKNDDMVKKLEKEQHYIAALALAKRQDLLNRTFDTGIVVFETLEEVNVTTHILTEDIKEYYGTDILIFSVCVGNLGYHEFVNNMLTVLSDNIIIYVTLSGEHNVLKTTCIKMGEKLGTTYILVPYKATNETELFVNVKVVLNIPRVHDQKQTLTLLYREDIFLTADQFIRTQKTTGPSWNGTESVDDSVDKIAIARYGNVFNFKDPSEDSPNYSFYIKLPHNIKELLKAGCEKHLPRPALLLKQLNNDEFLKSKKTIVISLGNERMKLTVHNDGFTNPLIKITSQNAKATLQMRNFLADLIFHDYKGDRGKEFISCSFYTSTENFIKSLKKYTSRWAVLEDILPLMEQFEKNIIGVLPL